jgi:hypothetical protein
VNARQRVQRWIKREANLYLEDIEERAREDRVNLSDVRGMGAYAYQEGDSMPEVPDVQVIAVAGQSSYDYALMYLLDNFHSGEIDSHVITAYTLGEMLARVVEKVLKRKGIRYEDTDEYLI